MNANEIGNVKLIFANRALELCGSNTSFANRIAGLANLLVEIRVKTRKFFTHFGASGGNLSENNERLTRRTVELGPASRTGCAQFMARKALL